MLVWGFCKLFHERVSLTGVSTVIIQNVYLMSCDGHNSARSMKSREETQRNSLGSVSLGCLNLFPALSQCHCLQQFWWNTFASRRWTKAGVFPSWALSRWWAWDVPGVGFALCKPQCWGCPLQCCTGHGHFPSPAPSKSASTQEPPTRWVFPLDCFVQLPGACCLCAEV